MSVFAALHACAALLLVVAGVAKLWRPAAAVADLLGLRASTPVARLVGGCEAAVGVAALTVGGAASWATGLLYAAFSVVVLRAMAADAPSCGCFGSLDAPPSWVHVGGNLALGAVSFAAAAKGSAPLGAIMHEVGDSPAVGLLLAVEIVVVAGLSLVCFTALPEALGVRNRRDEGTLFRAVPPLSSAGRR